MSTMEAMAEKRHDHPLPVDWQRFQLADIAEINPARPRGFQRDPAAPTTFVPMAAVDGLTGSIIKPETRPYSEVAVGYTYFAEGDVLFAKITPCMQNGKHAVASDLIDGIGFASTEFHVIRPQRNVLADWVYFFVRQPSVLHDATNHFTGAVGQQRVPDSFLRALSIPLPPLSAQRRIAAAVREQIEAIVKARLAAQGQLEAAEALPAAFMRQSLEGNDCRLWPKVPIGSLCRIEACQVDPKLTEYSDLPHVNGENIESGTGKLYGVKSAAQDRMTSGKYLFKAGVLLYSKLRPYLRKVAIAEFRGLCSADMYPLSFDLSRVDRHFALCVLLGQPFTDYAVGESQRARMPKLNRDQLFAWPFPLPAMHEQRRIAEALERQINGAQNLKEQVLAEIVAIDHVRAAVLRSAFTGGI